VVNKFVQGNSPFCLSFSLAAAVSYCRFPVASRYLVENATIISAMCIDEASMMVRAIMLAGAPLIGLPKLFNIRPNTKAKKMAHITITDLTTMLTPFPTLVILERFPLHALCVVDDLIFDAISNRALKLCKETFSWIFNNENVKIAHAYRFMTKFTPKGTKKTKEKYTCEMVMHF